MRFLIVSNSKHLVPPDVMAGVIDATKFWIQKNKGKIEQSWGFAGSEGGGGIIDVGSLEELDIIMTEFPMGPYSKTQIYGLVDLEASLDRGKIAIEKMTARV